MVIPVGFIILFIITYLNLVFFHPNNIVDLVNFSVRCQIRNLLCFSFTSVLYNFSNACKNNTIYILDNENPELININKFKSKVIITNFHKSIGLIFPISCFYNPLLILFIQNNSSELITIKENFTQKISSLINKNLIIPMYLIRRFVLYQPITYQNMDLNDFLTYIQSPKLLYSFCFDPPIGTTFSAIISLYRRNYLKEQLESLNNQTLKPKTVLLLQNQHKIIFNFKDIINCFPEMNIVYVWCYNFNTYFHGKFIFGAFLNSSYTIGLDDDRVLTDADTLKKALNVLSKGNYILGNVNAYYKPKGDMIKKHTSYADHTNTPLFFQTISSKYFMRLPIPTVFGGDDISLCVSANLLCNYSAFKTPFTLKMKSYQSDGNQQLRDQDLQTQIKLSKLPPLYNYIYSEYAKMGYHHLLSKREKNDIDFHKFLLAY